MMREGERERERVLMKHLTRLMSYSCNSFRRQMDKTVEREGDVVCFWVTEKGRKGNDY